MTISNKRLLWKYGGILVVSLFIPVLFGAAKHPFLSQDYLFHDAFKSFVYTVIYWEVNLFIFDRLKRRFPKLSDNKKRLIYELILVTAFSSLFGIFGCRVINTYIFNEEWSLASTMFYLKISMGVTYFILAIYEGVEFFNRWKESLVATEKLEREKLISQFEALKQQVSPHFLFNTLNTLMTLIPEDSDKALKFTEHLSKVYRYVLMNKDLDTVSLASELEFVESFYYLNRIRFGESLNLDVKVPSQDMDVRLAPLSLQILIENAIKHNEVSNGKPLNIEIYLNGKKDIIVRNNLQKKANTTGTRIGLENIMNRYKLLGPDSVQVSDNTTHFAVTLPSLATT